MFNCFPVASLYINPGIRIFSPHTHASKCFFKPLICSYLNFKKSLYVKYIIHFPFFIVLLGQKQELCACFFSRSFNINRVAAQAVEDVLNIGEY